MNKTNYSFSTFDKCYSVKIENITKELQNEINTLFTESSVRFIFELVTTFNDDIDQLYIRRKQRKCDSKCLKQSLKFKNSSQGIEKNWKIARLPRRLLNRHLDLGDVSPADINHFKNALNSNVQGIQVDFDDGHCPTWKNQIIGLFNVYKAVHDLIPNVPKIQTAPLLVLRPRAWNMIEYNIFINGKAVPGPLFDFGMLIYHNAHLMMKNECGPFFYLSKIEGSNEAELWNNIFIWTENKLNLPPGTIKACVLIENILSAFEMDEILYALKDHAIGLNCGIWDYAASIICKFGDDPNFLFPDRTKYVNMERNFLKRYMQLLIRVCHARGALATGGMAAALVPPSQENSKEVIEQILKSKKIEIEEGIDGFMVYDIKLVPYVNQLWKSTCGNVPNQLEKKVENLIVTEDDLLTMPKGGVTLQGLNTNIKIAILFIYNWFCGKGHFYYNNSVEDSATAEISRSQIWQWIRQQAIIEDNNEVVTYKLVQHLSNQFIYEEIQSNHSAKNLEKLLKAQYVFFEVITLYDFPDFITSYLSDKYIFRAYHDFADTKLKLKYKL